MLSLADLVGRLLPGAPHLSALFAALLLLHVPAGLAAVVTGAVAAASRKRRGRHPTFGTVYCGALAIVFVTATGMALLRWTEDWHLFLLGTISFGFGALGYAARRVRWKAWTGFHIVGMGLSYVVLLTAFYVDNGPHLPVWDRLPSLAYWTLPALVGLPLIIGALRRHASPIADLSTAPLALTRATHEGRARKTT